jgi:hypothetical protein
MCARTIFDSLLVYVRFVAWFANGCQSQEPTAQAIIDFSCSTGEPPAEAALELEEDCRRQQDYGRRGGIVAGFLITITV